ncbi:adenylate/guanylate cyclase domain-containing protein [Bradyrhizobium arachidis]|uniref:adenylate/guanylate cyclase domain-containing protein n=1 Tax=Bradyrhizobium arachidis TaxID=858423 RepID=UPI002163A9B2|nr:adenylate/guanylate cyclase domain-containing protein [Bradyrhizobium arachidis]UVO27042.1 AAA family ATPase [Bradyrhizobium arachidis]
MNISAWLRGLGLERYGQAFRDNAIDEAILPTLTAEDLRDLGVTAVGHRRILLNAIAALRVDTFRDTTEQPVEPKRFGGKVPEAERRQLTVMFADLVGSTALSARLDPEELRDIIGAYHRRCAEIITRSGGFVAKYLGDGVLAYFGYPRAHEEDAERAVRAGLALIDGVAKLDTGHATKLRVRIGIATGLVVVGDLLGEGAAQEQAVIGETPNLAARLQGLAEPNAVVIAEGTRRILGGLFDYRDLGTMPVAGINYPVHVWQVLGASLIGSRFEALRAASTPLIGREEEIALLMRRWERARTGEGSVVLIVGEPGIGKSRIAQTLLEQLDKEPHTRLRFFCSPHHQHSALYPSITQLEQVAGFRREDTAETRLDKLVAVLALASTELSEAVPLLADLLSIPAGNRYPPLDLTPQKRKEKTLEVQMGQVQGLAARQPLLMLWEDIHWSDPTTLESLDLLIDRAAALRVLMILTFRPEFTPPWVGRPHVTLLSLNRLPPRQRAEMIAHVAGGTTLPKEIGDQIIDRTDGIPLFIEELTKSVVESGWMTNAGDQLAIPTTLQASLLARLDRLAPTREAAQIAATLGRQFSHELITAVADMSQQQLEDALEQLIRAELVFRRGTPPDATYTFKHALVQDAAYSTLLRPRRQQLHARIAEALEARVIGNAETLPEIIAHHCTEAGLTERAIKYWWQAAQLAIQRSATLESIAHLQHGLRLLQTLPDHPEHVCLELDMQVALATACMAAKGWSSPVTVAAIARAEELCERVDDPRQRSIADFGRYVIYLLRGQTDAALATSTAMLGRAERKQDSTAMMIAHRCIGIVQVHRGEFDLGRTHMAEAFTLYDPKEHADLAYRFSYEPQVANLSYLAHALHPLGYPDQAQQAFNQLLEVIRAQRHNPSIAFGLFQASLFCIFERDAGAYKRHGHIGVDESIVDELIAVCTEHGFFLWRTAGIIMKGWLMVRAGEADRGLRQLREGIAAWRGDAKAMVTHWLLLLANALGSLGQLQASLDAIDEALALIPETNERWKEAALYLCKGELLLELSARDEAEASFQRALAVARNQRARLWELRAAKALARLWVEKVERRKAQDILASVYAWFTEGFDTPDLENAKHLLDELARTAPSSPC